MGRLDISKFDPEYLRSKVTDFSQFLYLCGPKQMVADLKSILGGLGAKSDAIVFEK